jgi:hypothetical protein
VQASPAKEALLAVESSAMFVLIGSVPHTALLAGRYRRTGKASSHRSMFEIGRACAFAIGAAIPARRVSGRWWHRTAHPAHADTEGPYVLLGHSYGGLYTQMYAARYSDEVAGVALVDSLHLEQFTRSPEGRAMYKRTRSPRRSQDPQPSPWLCAL